MKGDKVVELLEKCTYLLLLSVSGLTVGETYEVPGPEISEAIMRYWQQKLFSNVSIEADSIVGGKIYLHIKLTAQPRISSINYNGVKKSEREELEKKIDLHAGSQFSTDLSDRAKHVIKRYFEGKGYKNATVEIVQKEDVTADNRVIVDVNINKNEKIKIHKIYITGLDSANHTSMKKALVKLKKSMKKTKEKSFRNMFRSKKFVPEKYEEICTWYDGYRFGETEIFNPWSVINYFGNDSQARAYWQSTGRDYW